MENNLDQNIREKLQGREIQPSASAWERLSTQLDDAQQKRKRGWFLYMGYAASILLIVSLVLFFNKKDESEVQNFVVEEEVKTPEIDTSIDFKTPVEEDEVIVQKEDNETLDVKTSDLNTKTFKTVDARNPVIKKSAPKLKSVVPEEVVIAKQSETKETKFVDPMKKIKELDKVQETDVASIHQDTSNLSSKKGIYVDSEALLLSVTSTREELRAFYQKYKVDRAEVLATIQDELKKSNLKIDPNTILAEVEKDVNEESFQNNFYQFIKKRVSGVATAIANRNN
jgi:hypothetical protein